MIRRRKWENEIKQKMKNISALKTGNNKKKSEHRNEEQKGGRQKEERKYIPGNEVGKKLLS